MVKYAKCSGLALWLFSITSTPVCPLKSLADTLDLIVWGGDGMGEEGGMKSAYQAFQQNAYPWFLERVYKLEGDHSPEN